jgi:hypothetical protein
LNVAAYSLTIGADLSSVYVTKTINLAFNGNDIVEHLYKRSNRNAHSKKKIQTYCDKFLRENIGDL